MLPAAGEGPSVIRAEDLAALTRPFGGCQLFSAALEAIDSHQGLLSCLAQYVQFNAVFGSGVASLAGAISCRHDLFRDPDDPLPAFADRCTEVAAAIFYSAIDEFGGSHGAYPTHRAMAKDFLRAAARHAGCPLPLVPARREFSDSVADGYGIGRNLDDAEMFAGIGFHLGSELLADEEFGVLDGFLRSRYLNLVSKLQQDRTPAGHSAYLWVQVHTTVEADHFESGLTGACQALEFYAGAAGQRQMRDMVLAGTRRFAGLHADFMRVLAP